MIDVGQYVRFNSDLTPEIFKRLIEETSFGEGVTQRMIESYKRQRGWDDNICNVKAKSDVHTIEVVLPSGKSVHVRKLKQVKKFDD